MINNCNFWTSEIFFDRLNFFLNDRNWSLYQLCLSADISVDTLYKLRKHHRLPTLRTVCTICDALEISLPEFFIMPFAAQEYSILLQKLKSLSEILLSLRTTNNLGPSKSHPHLNLIVLLHMQKTILFTFG